MASGGCGLHCSQPFRARAVRAYATSRRQTLGQVGYRPLRQSSRTKPHALENLIAEFAAAVDASGIGLQSTPSTSPALAVAATTLVGLTALAAVAATRANGASSSPATAAVSTGTLATPSRPVEEPTPSAPAAAAAVPVGKSVVVSESSRNATAARVADARAWISRWRASNEITSHPLVGDAVKAAAGATGRAAASGPLGNGSNKASAQVAVAAASAVAAAAEVPVVAGLDTLGPRAPVKDTSKAGSSLTQSPVAAADAVPPPAAAESVASAASQRVTSDIAEASGVGEQGVGGGGGSSTNPIEAFLAWLQRLWHAFLRLLSGGSGGGNKGAGDTARA